jgi:hypothetical protein
MPCDTEKVEIEWASCVITNTTIVPSSKPFNSKKYRRCSVVDPVLLDVCGTLIGEDGLDGIV